MKRLIACVLLAGVSAPLLGQDVPDLIKLSVKANPAPVPALKYSLLPTAHDIKPGNAALLYFRAYSPEWWAGLQRQPGSFWEDLDKARAAPLDKLDKTHLKLPAKVQIGPDGNPVHLDPLYRVRSNLPLNMLKELDRAARREFCDWEMTPRVAEEGALLPLPDLQGMRQMTILLAIRSRLAMADGDLNQAVYTFQTALQLAKHVGEGSTIINALVGVACGMITLQQIDDFIQLTRAPNLYWALTQLPRPFVDLHRPLIGERLLVDREFADVRDMEKGPVPLEQAQRAMDELIRKSAYWGRGTDKQQMMIECMSLYPKAKQALVSRGTPPDVVEKMPAMQVVLLDSLFELDRWRDDSVKWMGLPYAQGSEGLKHAADAAKAVGDSRQALSLVLEFRQALDTIRVAQLRIDRKVAILRCVEAIKLHVADHGWLPASLDEIKSAPVPLDPMTDKPFEYQMEKETAILIAPLNGQHKGNGWRYEITIRK